MVENMKILIVNKLNQSVIVITDILPRIGDSIDKFYKPYPIVTHVLLWPQDKTMADNSIDAVVTVE
jgi:hypothetical protein